MNTRPTERALTVVVGHDFSDPAGLALAEAISLATSNPGAVLHVLGVLGHGAYRLGERPLHHYSFAEAEATQRRLERLVLRAMSRRGADDVEVYNHCRIGQPAALIVGLAGEVHADLVVIGTHGRGGVERLLLGSVAETVIRRAPCPVLVMRPTRHGAEAAAGVRAEGTGVGHEASADDGPTPEPPCEACVARRLGTAGAEPWCEAHAGAYMQPHRYGYVDEGIARTRPDEWALW